MVAEVRAEGRTVFLSSHILSEVESMCDRVGIIREGRLVRVGGVAELKDIRRHDVGSDLHHDAARRRLQRPRRRGACRDAARRPDAAPDGAGRTGCGRQSRGAVSARQPRQPRAQPGGYLPALLPGRRSGRRDGRRAVWLRSIFLKTLRDYRVAILGWGLGIGVLVPIVFAGFSTFIDSPEALAGLLALVQNPAFRLFGEPVDIVHAGGYATWRLSIALPMRWRLGAAGGKPHAARRGGARIPRLAALCSPVTLPDRGREGCGDWNGAAVDWPADLAAGVCGRQVHGRRTRTQCGALLRAQHRAPGVRLRGAGAAALAIHARASSGRRA